jgi:DNA mismatch repair protein MutS
VRISRTSSLAGFGADGLRPAIAAAGALLRYAQATQARALPHLQRADRRT